MRIYVSADLEGIHGVDRYDDHDIRNSAYQEWKRRVGQLMLDEILALHRGFTERGDISSYVLDSHGFSNTLQIPDDIPDMVQVRRTEKNYVHFPGLDEKFGGIILWGYHVKSGSAAGRLAHTASRRIKCVSINGRDVGETYVHAYYASFFSVPLLAVSGDDGLEKEISRDIGNIPFFNSGIGDRLPREKYLQKISDFAAALDFDRAVKINRTLHWPESSSLLISYHNPVVNLGRWILRGQFRYARLKGPGTCVYTRGSFIDQWDQFSGFYRK